MNSKEAVMARIIAGRFQEQTEIAQAMEELLRAGFPRDRISSFFLNPAGQHDVYPIGGDEAMSPGAKESDKGAATGVAAGAVAGIAATPFLGPLGPVTGGLLGAYIGGLVGGLSQMKERGDIGEHAEDPRNAAPVRQSGMFLAVAVGDDEHEDRAINLLRSVGAQDLERADGTIVDGDWSDFDPVGPPSLINALPNTPVRRGPYQRA
jgi:hypothetical protein